MNWKRGALILAILLVIAIVAISIPIYNRLKPIAEVPAPAEEIPKEVPVQETKEPEQEAAKEITVHISRFEFDQPNITIEPGTKVIWVNDDTRRHVITNPHLNLFYDIKKILEQGDTFEYTFTKQGTYEILEANFGIHGVVIVKANSYDKITGYMVYNLETKGTDLLTTSLNLFVIVSMLLLIGFYLNIGKRK